MTADRYRLFWLARDRDGALWIFDDTPIWDENVGRWDRPPATTRNPDPPNTTTWYRVLPPRWFPEVGPGEKRRARLEVERKP